MDGTIPTANIWLQWSVAGVIVIVVFALLREFKAFIRERDNQWQVFLREQRDADTKTQAELAVNMKELTAAVAQLRDDFNAHDAAEKTWIEYLIEQASKGNPQSPARKRKTGE
jgi:hypothetical protein